MDGQGGDRMPNSFTFNGQFAYCEGVCDSHDISDILLVAVPGARAVQRASVESDRTGVDYWVTVVSGDRVAVDVKVRSVDPIKAFSSDDLALETWSAIGSKRVGWSRDPHKRTDYVLWYFEPTHRYALYPFLPLCRAFMRNWKRWSDEYRTQVQQSDGWQSECVYVPRLALNAAIEAATTGTVEQQRELLMPARGKGTS